MYTSNNSRLWVAAACVLLVSSAAAAQSKKSSASEDQIKATRSLWDASKMMTEACDGISRRYKLDNKQKDRTCSMITDRTSKVLKKFDKVLWSTLAELAPYQLSGDLPDAETARRIARDAYPIFLEAQKEVLKAQDEFRQMLTDEQKKIHDKDLKNLRRTFSQMERTFSDWKQGNVRNIRSMNPAIAGGRRLMTDNRKRSRPESKWDAYVAQFIADYRLDEAQKVQALSVLTDLKDKAAQYRRTSGKEIREAETLLKEVQSRRPIDVKELNQAKMILDLYNKPFDDWFSELKERLNVIPRDKQKEDYYKRFPHKRPVEKDKKAVQPAPKESKTETAPDSATKPADDSKAKSGN